MTLQEEGRKVRHRGETTEAQGPPRAGRDKRDCPLEPLGGAASGSRTVGNRCLCGGPQACGHLLQTPQETRAEGSWGPVGICTLSPGESEEPTCHGVRKEKR